MTADQHASRLLHRFRIQRAAGLPRPAPIQRQRCPAVDDAVDIAALHGGDSGVEVLGHRFGLQHGDGYRPHVVVQPVADRPIGEVLFQVEMRHLPQRVYAGIRTPGTMDAYDLSGQSLHRLLQALLDGRAVVLPLPADKFPAVILDGQFPPVHDAASTLPTATLKPRRKAAPSTGALPGRCTRISRTAPSAQATVRLPSSRVPGLASGAACAGSAASTLIRSLPRSNQTPGHGLSARTCRSMKSAGWLQSSRPSSRLSLAA